MKCEEGYRCEVCGKDVDGITESDLYLRFVIGLIEAETLHTTPERHICCNPSVAQFITASEFEPVVVEGDFDKRCMDSSFVAQREELLTRGWLRLKEIAAAPGDTISLLDYPLEEFREP